MPDHPFVFIIGFNKAATTSLHRLFEASAFPSVHWDGGRLAATMLSNVSSERPVMAGYDERYRVFSDMTFRTSRFRFEGNSLFRAMDADYPHAFFIYNTRDLGAWQQSRAAHTSRVNGETLLAFEMRLMKTGDRQRVFDKWARDREMFEHDIRQHFEHSGRLLEIDIDSADVPSRLSAFIGHLLDSAHWQRHNPRAEEARGG